MKNILIIAGHGGTPYDPGACGCGQKEAVLTRELAKLVQTELQKIADVSAKLYDVGNDAYKILRNGGTLPLSGIDYVLELHFNAAANDLKGDGRTTGTEVLVHTSEGGVTVEECICKKIAALGFKNRGVKRRSNLLVMNTVKKKYGISHALIETCFIDDADDMKLYVSVKEKVARAIAAGVADGFGLFMPQQPPVIADKTEAKGNTAQEIFDELNPLYTALPDIPEAWREPVAAMVECGAIRGDGRNTLALRYDALQAAIIAYRMMQDFVPEIVYGFYNQCNPLYQSLEEVPDYWKEEVATMIKSGAIKGDGLHEIYMRHDTLQAAVIAYRMMLLQNK